WVAPASPCAHRILAARTKPLEACRAQWLEDHCLRHTTPLQQRPEQAVPESAGQGQESKEKPPRAPTMSDEAFSREKTPAVWRPPVMARSSCPRSVQPMLQTQADEVHRAGARTGSTSRNAAV